MPTQQIDTRPQRVHGITPTPFEIPAQYLPSENQPPSKRPLMISIVAVYMLIKAVVSLLLALVPWSDPDSDLSNFLIAHPSLAFSMLPRAFRPALVMAGQSASAYVQGLPFIFLVVGILCGLLAFKLWTLSPRWRWATMFWSAWSIASTVRFIALDSILRSSLAIPLPPMSAELRLALFMSITWNVLIFCYLGFYPGVKEAFEEYA